MTDKSKQHTEDVRPGKPAGQQKQVTVSVEEAIKGLAVTQEAIINLLDKKGILKKDELMAEIQRIKALLDNPNRN